MKSEFVSMENFNEFYLKLSNLGKFHAHTSELRGLLHSVALQAYEAGAKQAEMTLLKVMSPNPIPERGL